MCFDVGEQWTSFRGGKIKRFWTSKVTGDVGCSIAFSLLGRPNKNRLRPRVCEARDSQQRWQEAAVLPVDRQLQGTRLDRQPGRENLRKRSRTPRFLKRLWILWEVCNATTNLAVGVSFKWMRRFLSGIRNNQYRRKEMPWPPVLQCQHLFYLLALKSTTGTTSTSVIPVGYSVILLQLRTFPWIHKLARQISAN